MQKKSTQEVDHTCYSVKDVADLTGLHPNTVYNLVKSGELRAKIVGKRRVVIRKQWFENWLERT